jgi:ketosteroid isomerase-like protein
MSQENVEVVRRIVEHVNETGEAGPLELYDPDITFTTRGEVGGSATFTGHQGLRRAEAMFAQVWAETHTTIVELIEGEDVVVAVVRIELRSQAGVSLEVEEAWAYWIRNGKLVRIEQHGAREKALAAAGLSE